jgi:proline dehydrogenase
MSFISDDIVYILDTGETVTKLAEFSVGAILDYSVEGENSEAGFDQTKQEVLRTIDKAKDSEDIPFCVFKMTGIADINVLERIQNRASLTLEEQEAYTKVTRRVDEICRKAYDAGVPILIDAEESWIQRTIDDLANAMILKYNKEKAIVYNTYQMYCKSSLDNLNHAILEANSKGHYLGAKLVRGAYMEKERERAEQHGYKSPIHKDKSSTDRAFNDALTLCIENIGKVSVMCGSHNEYSNQWLVALMEKHVIACNDNHVWFAQLFGMSDNITFNLAKEHYNVVKYLPYGPVKSVMPYLLRRAEENTSVAGQSSRELTLIRKELKRRRAQS